MIKQIVPNLWLNDTAEELVTFYSSVFEDVKVSRTDRYTDAGKEHHGHEAGDVMTIEFSIYGKQFVALNGGPLFTMTPANSFFVRCSSIDETEALWNKLTPDATILMPMDEYPFSRVYGWLNDKFGVSWQIITNEEPSEQRIIPSLMFVGKNAGRAHEAIDFYTSVFPNSSTGPISTYDESTMPDMPNASGKIAYGEFTLGSSTFAIMDSPIEHDFDFTAGVSYMVTCDTQDEIDTLWNQLSAVPEAEQCGWLVDKFGVSWQIVPEALNRLLQNGTPEQKERVTAAFMQMKKFDIAGLQAAYNLSR